MTSAEHLRAARALLLDASRWTTGASARARSGAPVDPKSRNARCWCAQGALARAAEDGVGASGNFLIVAAHSLYDAHPFDVNDEMGHGAVLRMYDCAIELAEAQS